jgi:hypothetical protein
MPSFFSPVLVRCPKVQIISSSRTGRLIHPFLFGLNYSWPSLNRNPLLSKPGRTESSTRGITHAKTTSLYRISTKAPNRTALQKVNSCPHTSSFCYTERQGDRGCVASAPPPKVLLGWAAFEPRPRHPEAPQWMATDFMYRTQTAFSVDSVYRGSTVEPPTVDSETAWFISPEFWKHVEAFPLVLIHFELDEAERSTTTTNSIFCLAAL